MEDGDGIGVGDDGGGVESVTRAVRATGGAGDSRMADGATTGAAAGEGAGMAPTPPASGEGGSWITDPVGRRTRSRTGPSRAVETGERGEEAGQTTRPTLEASLTSEVSVARSSAISKGATGEESSPKEI